MKLVHNDFLGACILLLLFFAVILTAELWSRLWKPNPELPRKFVHIVGGLGCLLFPFFIDSPGMVAVLAGLFALVFAIGQKNTLLQCLSSVSRKSRGSEYYPIAVAILFYISQDRLWLYFTSILILTISDGAAALIGSNIGRVRYPVGPDDMKSLEGSLAFMLFTFLLIFILLQLMTDLAAPNCVGVAFLTSVLLTGIEAISIKGTDNIFVPVLTCYILLKITTKPLDEIIFQCVSLVVIFSALQVVIRYFKLLSVRDSIIFTLFSYATWSLGSVDWSLPIFGGFVLYCICRALVPNIKGHQVVTESLLRVLSIPLVVLVLANATEQYNLLFGPYLTATIIATVLSTWIYLLVSLDLKGSRRYMLCIALAGLVPFCITGLFYFRLSSVPQNVFAVFFVISVTLTFIYDLYLLSRAQIENVTQLSRPIGVTSVVSAVTYLLVQHIEFVPLWNPLY